jgi:hypothetical protein
LQALKDPAVRDYIGPYGQYRSTAQGKAPYEMLGKIPPAVVDLEQNIARVKNYSIKLITGAQMSEPEAQRIMKELPDLGQQPDVLARRMAATDANNAMMEGIIRDLVMRGNPQAQAFAKEVGLEGVRLGAPNGAGIGNRDAAPQNQPQPKGDAMLPAGQYSGKIVRDTVTGKRYRSDGKTWSEVK